MFLDIQQICHVQYLQGVLHTVWNAIKHSVWLREQESFFFSQVIVFTAYSDRATDRGTYIYNHICLITNENGIWTQSMQVKHCFRWNYMDYSRVKIKKIKQLLSRGYSGIGHDSVLFLVLFRIVSNFINHHSFLHKTNWFLNNFTSQSWIKKSILLQKEVSPEFVFSGSHFRYCSNQVLTNLPKQNHFQI